MDTSKLQLRVMNYWRQHPMNQKTLAQLMDISEHTFIRVMKHKKGCYNICYLKMDKFLSDWEQSLDK